MGWKYSQIIAAKDGNLIPLCKNSQTEQEVSLHSKYNPVREADGFTASIPPDCAFFVILGVAGGYHIERLSEKFSNCKILAVETDDDSLAFLSQIPAVQKLRGNKRVNLTSLSTLEKNLPALYKPAIHGNLSVLPLRQWESIFCEEAELARKKITATIKLLSADFSVQSHFGKIWQKNILSNLSLAEKLPPFNPPAKKNIQEKTAAIIAAGPSLDESIPELKKNRDSYYMIATDTAFSALLRHGIGSDAVVSIDGQMISHEHYMEQLPRETLYVFDLCANPSSVRKAFSVTKNVLLAETGHPLAQYASFFDGARNFIHLDAGSGTVTIAAASLARLLGFPNDKIAFFGADFAYIGGRPYARGTYLESKFHSRSDRLGTAEKSYTALMYRTPTVRIAESRITTEILDAYRASLDDFMRRKPSSSAISVNQFNLKRFKSRYRKDLRETFRGETDFDEDSNAFTTLLPLCAKMGKGSAFVAYLKTLEYTDKI